MGTRTVRLHDEAERTLSEITEATGLTVSAALKRGLMVLREEVARKASATPYDVYAKLDLGPGGYAAAASGDAKRAIASALRRKHRR